MEEKEEKELGKRASKNRAKEKNKKVIIYGVVGCAVFIIFLFSVIFAILNMGNNKILKGISINEIDVSNLTKEEAVSKLNELIKDKKENEITAIYGEYEVKINPTVLELNYDVNSAVEEAYSVGRSGNLFTNNYGIISNFFSPKKFVVNYKINEEVAQNTINEISANIPGAIIQSSYYIEDDELIITKGSKGKIVNEEKLISEIKEIFDELTISKNNIEIPVIEKEPDEIDVDKIHEEVYQEVKDAYYTKEPFSVYPEVEGIDFNVDEVKEMLKEDKTEYVVKLIITKPAVTIDQIGEEAFPDLLASFTTKYDSSNTGRTTNLRLASEKINGVVLTPGEEFSYNKIVGERTIAAGYKEAKVYSNGEVVDGIGGGICQISSTLYNAVVMANLEVTVRRNHQFVTSYVEAGRDATVVYGSQDFKFKNTRKYPIKVNASVNSGVAKISIYGLKEENEYDISFQSNTVSTIPFTIKYEDDNTLAPGEEKVKQKGANGLITETYKIVRQNGVIVSKTLLSKDTYNAMNKIIKRGVAVSQPDTQEIQTPATKIEKPKQETPKQEEPKQEEPKKTETQNTTPTKTEENKTTNTSTKNEVKEDKKEDQKEDSKKENKIDSTNSTVTE